MSGPVCGTCRLFQPKVAWRHAAARIELSLLRLWLSEEADRPRPAQHRETSPRTLQQGDPRCHASISGSKVSRWMAERLAFPKRRCRCMLLPRDCDQRNCTAQARLTSVEGIWKLACHSKLAGASSKLAHALAVACMHLLACQVRPSAAV